MLLYILLYLSIRYRNIHLHLTAHVPVKVDNNIYGTGTVHVAVARSTVVCIHWRHFDLPPILIPILIRPMQC